MQLEKNRNNIDLVYYQFHKKDRRKLSAKIEK